MKKLLLIPAFISLVACSKSRSLSDLKMNVDKPADVEAKFGKPDSISRVALLGMSKEVWFYKKDSIYLQFDDDILIDLLDLKEIQRSAKNRADSISEALSAQLDSVAEQ